MAEAPKIVTRARRQEPETKAFRFTEEMISQSASAGVNDYRRQAWEAYTRLPIPDLKMEAWRSRFQTARKPGLPRPAPCG
jgi:hypothetical protein